MQEDDPKPGVVIDVQAEQEAEAPETGHASATRPHGHGAKTEKSAATGSGVLPVLAVTTLVAVIGAVVFGHRYWTDLRADLDAMSARVAGLVSRQQVLQQAVGGASTTLEQQQAALSDQRDVLREQQEALERAERAFLRQEQKLADESVMLQEREAQLRAAVADVHDRVGRAGNHWVIAEVEYLIRVANHRLNLARDTATARVALEIADQRLRDTKDPGWTGVRAQLARDITRLSTFDAPDPAGLSARLAAMIERIPRLKIARATTGPERMLPEPVARKPGERSWDTLLDDLWSGVKNSVRISKRDRPVQAMLAPDQQFFLYENLKLQLESARLGVARGDQALWRVNLSSAAEWLDRYFDATDRATRVLRQGIDDMLDVDIAPQLPDLSKSLRALRGRMRLLDGAVPGAETAGVLGRVETR